MDNPKPRKLGNMYCFWYNAQGNPRIVIGPDWKFSILELALVNGIIGSILHSLDKTEQSKVFYAGLFILLFHDLFFILTVTMN